MPEVLVELIAPGRRNRPGTPLNPKSVTLHNTDNTDRGAGAKAHSKFVRTKGYYDYQGKRHWVSWHYVVDDQHIIQQIPLDECAWHAGVANAQSVAIEICMNSDMNANEAYENAAALVATLVSDLNLRPQDIVTHRSWTGKNCPRVLLVGNRWQIFLQRVGEILQQRQLVPSAFANDWHDAGTGRWTQLLELEDAQHEIDHAKLKSAVNAFRKSQAGRARGTKSRRAKSSQTKAPTKR